MTYTQSISEQALESELPHLQRYARSLTSQKADADDLVQSCVYRALNTKAAYRPGTNLRRWLFTIMRNLRIDDYRKIGRRGHHIPLEDWQGEASMPGNQMDTIALKQSVEQINDLRPGERDVIRLSVFKGWRHDAIADKLGVSVGTVKSRLHRARAQLAA